MLTSINLFCKNCGDDTSHEIYINDLDRPEATCKNCKTLISHNENAKKYVLDGPPGSGKSTVLFGISDGENTDRFDATMTKKGFECIHESVKEANDVLADQGLDFTKNKALWLETILHIDLRKYFSLSEKTYFFDRCFHHWTLFSNATGIKLPIWYHQLNDKIRYSQPIILCAAVKSMDLNDEKIDESRRFSWQQRLDMYEEAKKMYESLGYKVVEVPMFHEEIIEDNSHARINHILNNVEK